MTSPSIPHRDGRDSDLTLDDVGAIFDSKKSPTKGSPSLGTFFGTNSSQPSQLGNDNILINLDSPPRKEANPTISTILPGSNLEPLKPAKVNPSYQNVQDYDDDMELTSVFGGRRTQGHHADTAGKIIPTNMESSAEDTPHDVEETMELTKSFGAITGSLVNKDGEDEGGMELTTIVGTGLRTTHSPGSHDDDDNDERDEMNLTKTFGAIQNMSVEGSSSAFTSRNYNKNAPDEISMDITRAIGQVLQSNAEDINNIAVQHVDEDTSMDITRAVGGLQQSLRHDADNDDASMMEATKVVGRGIKSHLDISGNDETMDITKAVGGVRALHQESQPSSKVHGIEVLRSDNATADDSMDVTKVIGGIQHRFELDADEDTGMDITRAVGNIILEDPAKKGSLDRIQGERSETAANEANSHSAGTIISENSMRSLSTWSTRLDMRVSTATTPIKALQERIVLMSPEKPKLHIPLLNPEEINSETEKTQQSPTKPLAITDNNISLNEFLSMISIDFMDKFLSNSRGHSSFGIPEEAVEGATEEDYWVASQKLPLLNMYDFGSHELKNDIKNAKEFFTQWEESVLEDNPVLFQEYVDASADTKQIMKSQFLLLKNFSRQQAKGAWYEWRRQLTNGLNKDLEKNRELLAKDIEILHEKRTISELANREAQARHEKLSGDIQNMKKQLSELANYNKEELIDRRQQVESAKKNAIQQRKTAEELRNRRESVIAKIEKLRSEKQTLHDHVKEAEQVLKANKIVDNKEMHALESNYKWLSQCVGLSSSELKEDVLSLQFVNGLALEVNIVTGSIVTRSHDESATFALLRGCLQKQIDHQSKQHAHIKSIIARANKMWDNACAINSAISKLELEFMTSVSMSEVPEELLIAIDLLLEDKQMKRQPCKVCIKVRYDAQSIVSYPHGSGIATVEPVFGDFGGRAVLEQIHDGVVSTLADNGLQGLSQICLQILRDFSS
ncbi:Spc105p [Sugiyamaella lignohabitans]|uniref:Spc105p n=1 Tax=Sugiyamaella lignohabitans TaxID=796027 RepID=A0A167FY55_9ASCO|nr:Spc105p [Sugiyamaella lignohabitans]ANB15853.1 Spc105p [Sugiyamaella lignohabitans]